MSYAEYVVTARKGGLQPSGRRFAYRLAETFFRGWPLYVIPLVLVVGYGMVQAKDSEPTFTASGTVRVANNPLLASVTPAATTDGFYWETAADTTARQINEQLGTDQFVDAVATTAGLASFLESEALTRDRLRRAFSVSAAGATLLRVAATWPDAATSLALTNALLAEYMSFVLDGQVLASQQAEVFWADLEETYQSQLDEAEDALTTFVQQNPAPAGGERPDDQALQLARLEDRVTAAQTQVTNAENRQQEAALATQQARERAGDSLQVVDAPKLPTSTAQALRDRLLTVAAYAVLGLIICSVALVVVTLLDRSVRTSEDVSLVTGLPVIATVPMIRRLRRNGTDPALRPPSTA